MYGKGNAKGNAKSTPAAAVAAAAAAATKAATAASAAAEAAANAANAAATAAAAVDAAPPAISAHPPHRPVHGRRAKALSSDVEDEQVEDERPHRCTLCTVRRAVVRTFSDVTDPNRRAMIALQTKLWAPGSTLTWALMPDGEYQHDGMTKTSLKVPEWVQALRDAFNHWQGLGIPITFREITDPNQALIRVTFFEGESWSYIGRDIKNIPLHESTMNIGFMNPNTTALHEVGHALGLEHEHQSPFSGITWNVRAVMEMVRGQGWPPVQGWLQIMNRVNPNDPAGPLLGTKWDPTSIMHYPFDADCIDAPEPYATDGIRQPTGLSSRDIAMIHRLYPAAADRPRRLKERQAVTLDNVESASVHAFEIIPNKTQKYKIEKFGGDAILVLLDINGQKIKADDDAGEERDGKLEVQLEKDVRYVLNLRIAYVEPDDSTVTVMLKPLSS